MARIAAVELFELDLPFRRRFRHAAADRARSESLFARFATDSGECGYGETLPRAYVTGESRAATFDLLAERLLPPLLEREFASFDEVVDFLTQCDGRPPPDWLEPSVPASAAWCLVDLGVLDAFGRAFGVDVGPRLARRAGGAGAWPEHLRYGVVVSGDSTRHALRTLAKARAYGIRDAKLKLTDGRTAGVRLARRVLGRTARIRVDSNMAWTEAEALAAMPGLARAGAACFEQPLAADELDGMARLVAATGLPVMADESVHDAASLERVIAARAATAVNVRIAKCGGLVASLARCRRASEAGLTLQIGCQVGETSQLSAAQLALIGAVGRPVAYAEGCFGERLLRTDPVRPLLQFGRGGRAPEPPTGPGFGTRVEMDTLRSRSGRHRLVGSARFIPAAEAS